VRHFKIFAALVLCRVLFCKRNFEISSGSILPELKRINYPQIAQTGRRVTCAI
jgi:hypothetical protein